ncbi:MAG: hypothetical protein M1298_00600 [Chloroflexi bacterium]|nr:hypothetical protein [Chloroflexota bacterium]
MKLLRQHADRRTLVKGAAIITAGTIGSAYVKPQLTGLGIPAALAASASTGTGKTQGYWVNLGGGGGYDKWSLQNDSNWNGVDPQPIYRGETWGSVFNTVPSYTNTSNHIVTYTGPTSTSTNATIGTVAGTTGSDPINKAAREIITSVLNAAYMGSPPYAYPVSYWINLWNSYASDSSKTLSDYQSLFSLLSTTYNTQ